MKLLLASLLGLTTAIIVFLGLGTLITPPEKIVKASHEKRSFEFTRHKKDTALTEKKREKPQPPKPVPATPKQLKLSHTKIEMPTITTPPTMLPTFKLSGIKAGNGLGFANVAQANMQVIPLVRIAPIYPKNALRAKKEGYVTLSFIVKTDGSVGTVKVIEAKPPRLFTKAAINAIRKWKFKAKTVNGVKIEQKGQQTIDFSLKERK
jgi:periplasmic protein TonB